MAAERITQNPHLEINPDHAGPHYDTIRTILINTGITNDQAIEILNASWTLSHEECVQAWNLQVIEDEVILQEERRLAQEQEDQQRAQRELELKNELQENKKKKPKMNDFDENTMVNNFIGPRLSAYALWHLVEFKYTELWYFTQEGCTDAMQQQTQNEDTFGLTKVDDMVSFRPVSALKASGNVVQDTKLSWCQMEIAKMTLIQQITKCGWAQKAITALTQFFMNLKVHHYQQWAYGEHALLTYQARVRHDWHDQLKWGNGFNIAIINEMLLQSIHWEIMDKKQAKALDEVSRPINSFLKILTHHNIILPIDKFYHCLPATATCYYNTTRYRLGFTMPLPWSPLLLLLLWLPLLLTIVMTMKQCYKLC